MKKTVKIAAFCSALLFSALYASAEEKTFFIPGKGKLTREVSLQHIQELDSKGRVTSEESESGPRTFYSYDKKGHLLLLSSGDFQISYDYNKKGFLTHTKNSDGLEEWYEYDKNGLLLMIKDSEGYGKKYSYDQTGKLIELSEIEFSHGKSEDEGEILLYSERYTYNNAGQKVKMEYSYGDSTLYFYDEEGRLVKESYSSGNYKEYIYSKEGKLLFTCEKQDDYEVESFFVYELTEDGKVKKIKEYYITIYG